MKGAEFIAKLKDAFDCETDSQLAKVLGRTPANIANWKRNKNLSAMVIARAMRDLVKRAEGETEAIREDLLERKVAESISSLVEYAPISSLNKPENKTVQIKAADGYGHLALRSTLEHRHGIYIFYSSLCNPIYVGKANSTELWTECNSAFNRDLKSDLCRVNHPNEIQKAPKKVKLSRYTAKVYDVATYLSAYEVDPALVDKVEALMIRSFINQLSNVKIENLAEIEKGEI